jgi:zinc protease
MLRFVFLFIGLLVSQDAFCFIEPVEIKTPKGVKAWFVKDVSPVISISLLFENGSAADPEGKEGLADMTASMMMEGAGGLDKETFQGKIQDLGITISIGARQDAVGVAVQAIKKDINQALNLTNLALTKPRFDQKDFDLLQKQQLAYIENLKQQPDRLAERKLFETLYKNHPYGKPPYGTIESVKNITVDDMRAFLKNHIYQHDLIVGITGNLTEKEAGQIIDRLLAGVPKKGKKVSVEESIANKKAQVQYVKQDIPQATVTFGQQGVSYKNKDFLAMNLAMYIFGTGQMSRLNEELRNRRGLVYYIYSQLVPLRHGALIQGAFSTSPNQVEEAISLLKTEWRRMRDHGPTKKELVEIKKYLKGSYPLSFTNSQSVANTLVFYQQAGWPIDYPQKRNKLIDSLTIDDIKRVSREYLHTDQLTFVIVGQSVASVAENIEAKQDEKEKVN